MLWLFGGLLGLHRFAVQKLYSGLAMLWSFIISLAGTVFMWHIQNQCTYETIRWCDLGAIGFSILLLCVIINWLKDIFFLRSWTRYVFLSLNCSISGVTETRILKLSFTSDSPN